MAKPWALLVSCEHGGFRIPREYRAYVSAKTEALLKTHRGWDLGALDLAKEVSKDHNAPLYFTETSRLLIDCNRTLSHKSCLGPDFREVDPALKLEIARDFYHPYRSSVIQGVKRLHKLGFRVLHCAFHSFTPELNGEVRNAEFGLLYDPSRSSEKLWANRIMATLKENEFPWRMRRNYPYLGKSDGFTKALRQEFRSSEYAGFELEFNHSLFADSSQIKLLKDQVRLLFGHLPLERT